MLLGSFTGGLKKEPWWKDCAAANLVIPNHLNNAQGADDHRIHVSHGEGRDIESK